MRISLLAEDGSPSDVTGEIAISSDYLADYWGNPQEAAARFDTDPAGVRRYRTGELARRLPDGRLIYLGRRDRQIKVRGYRVEPGEVELALGALPGLAHAAVVADHVRDEQLLRAFVTTTGDAPLEPSALRAALARTLPEYLLPATVTVVPDLPLTPTGKVDARALLERHPLQPPSVNHPNTSQDEQTLEGVIAAAWSHALDRDDIDRHDRFFDIGGHSLLAAQVHHELIKTLARRFPLTALYAHPTVASLADYLRTSGQASSTTNITDRMARRRLDRTRRGARL